MNLLIAYYLRYLLLFLLLFIGDNMNIINKKIIYYRYTGEVLYYYDSIDIIENTVYLNSKPVFSIIK